MAFRILYTIYSLIRSQSGLYAVHKALKYQGINVIDCLAHNVQKSYCP